MPARKRPAQTEAPAPLPPPRSETGAISHAGPHSGLGNIAAPGKLQEENRDSAITGGTRSLSRRVLGLDVLKPAPVSPSRRKASQPARKTPRP